MAEYNFGSIMNRDFILELKRMAEDVNVQGKTIQDLVAEGQLTEEQYANLITTVNGMLKSGGVNKFDLSTSLRSEINQLRDKINKGDVSINDLRPDLLSFIHDGTGGPLEIQSIPRRGSVTPEKTTFMSASTNKFNKNDVNNYYISDSGAEVSSDNFKSSHKIGVIPNENIYANGFMAASAFDDVGNFIVRLDLEEAGENFIAPPNAYELIFNFDDRKNIERQVNFSAEPLPYEPYKIIIEDIEFGEDSISVNNVDFIEHSTEDSDINIFDKNSVMHGGYYEASTLEWIEDSRFSQSDFIEAKAGDEIRFEYGDAGIWVVFKNADGEIFTGIKPSTSAREFTIPNGATAFSFNFRNAHIDSIMMVKNRLLPESFVPYGSLKFKDERLSASIMKYVENSMNIPESERRFYNVSFLGDSITWGYNPDDGSKLDIIWPDLVADKLNIPAVNNYGINGSTLAAPEDDGRNPFVDRYTSIDSNSDLICVFGGTNDWNNNIPVGNMEDNTKYTFYGALKLLAEGLYNDYPDATVVFFTPLHRSDGTNHATKGDIIEFRNAIIEVAERYAIPVLDLYATSGLYPENESNKNNFVPDGRHPNVAGHIKLAKRISGFLKTL